MDMDRKTYPHRYTGTQVSGVELDDGSSDFIHPNKMGAGPWAHRVRSDRVPALEEEWGRRRDSDPDNYSTNVKGWS